MNTTTRFQALEKRIAQLEQLLEGIVPFNTHIKLDQIPRPCQLLLRDRSGGWLTPGEKKPTQPSPFQVIPKPEA